MQIGIIGAGGIGQAFAAHMVKAGYDVILSNSRGPDSLRHVRSVSTSWTCLASSLFDTGFCLGAWRLADMGAKHAFLRAGFGFGHMPLWMVEDDLANGRLTKIRIQGFPERAQLLAMQAVCRKDAPPGPAGRAFIEHLKRTGAQ